MLVTPHSTSSANIKVVGVGGGGMNTINTMIKDHNIEGVEFIAVNTDAQDLKGSLANININIGPELTKGLGAGGEPEIGAKAAEESADQLHDALAGADMVFIAGGMGGGTGTGAIPVIGGIAQNIGALTVGVVTKPFNFEMKKRMDIALEGISRLKDNVDTMIVVPNQRILDIIDKNFSFVEAMKKMDEVLANAVKSISGLITQSDFINLDFADVRTVLRNAGTAMMGMGHATGESRAEHAARDAVNSPLLEMSIDGAKGLLFHIEGGPSMTMHEVDAAASLIMEQVDSNAIVKFGASVVEGLDDQIHVTVLAAGFDISAVTNKINLNTSLRNKDIPKSVEKKNIPKAKGTPKVNDPFSGEDLDVPAFLRKS